MSDHPRRSVERLCDICVVGGSAAALATALNLARQGRAVIVVDRDAQLDTESNAREQVRRHGGEVLAGRVAAVTELSAGNHRVELVGGHMIFARQVYSDGSEAATSPDIHQVTGDLRSANQRDWDRRYEGRQLWSGNPNGTLVQEVNGLAPGRALDVGAGEGGDAIWLAEQGWRVLASDIAGPALDRIAAEAARRGLQFEFLRADANAEAPFPAGAFDLVSAHYASIPRTPDAHGANNLMRAVAPGGTLLIVGHDLAPMRTPIDTSQESRIFDPDAYVRIEDFLALLEGDPSWTIELHEQRPRPTGVAASHHVDVVLRARRRPS